MNAPLDRRGFLELGSAAAAATAVTTLASDLAPLQAQEPKSANDKIVVGIMGVNGRGSALAKSFMGQKAEIAYICDVDERAVEKAVAMVGAGQSRKPAGVVDFRKILDDKSVDALVVA